MNPGKTIFQGKVYPNILMLWHSSKQLKKKRLSKKKHPLYFNSQVRKWHFSFYKWICLSLLIQLPVSAVTKRPEIGQASPVVNSSSVGWCSACQRWLWQCQITTSEEGNGCSTAVLWLLTNLPTGASINQCSEKNSPEAAFKYFQINLRYLQSEGTDLVLSVFHIMATCNRLSDLSDA